MTQDQLLRKAMMLLNQGKTSLARAICRKLIHQYPDDFNSIHLYGVVLLKDGEAQAACLQLARASELVGESKYRAQALSNLSQARLQCGDEAGALEAINSALALMPDEALFLLNRANLHERRRDWQTMQQDLEQALQLEPDLADAIISMAVCLRQQGKADEGLARLDAVHEDARDFDWLQEWALALCLSHQPERLLQFIDAMALDADTIIEIGHYLAEAGAAEDSMLLYRKGLKLAPDNQQAAYLVAAYEGQPQQRAPATYVRGLYDRHADEFEHRLQQQLEYDAPARLGELLPNWLAAELDQVIDLGCGTGLLGEVLARAFSINNLTGVDLSQQMLEKARAKGCYQQRVCSDILGFIPQAPAQLITAADVLIYLGDLKPLFSLLPQWLSTGGVFACTLELGDALTPELTPSGRFRHSEAYLQQLAESVGLELLLSASFPLRQERDKTVPGQIMLFRKP